MCVRQYYEGLTLDEYNLNKTTVPNFEQLYECEIYSDFKEGSTLIIEKYRCYKLVKCYSSKRLYYEAIGQDFIIDATFYNTIEITNGFPH